MKLQYLYEGNGVTNKKVKNSLESDEWVGTGKNKKSDLKKDWTHGKPAEPKRDGHSGWNIKTNKPGMPGTTYP